MKKLFTLSLLLVLALSVNAQTTYRKSWDFTKWSATTIANLKAEAAKTTVTVGADGKISDIANGEANWRDSEKKGADNYTKTQNNCFWQITHGKLDANGSVIEELAGLTFTNTNDAGLAIAVNYPNALNDYNGPCYLWLGSKNQNYFVIPHVAPGTTIKMGVESHKNSAARGVELYVGKGNTGTKLKDPNGNAVAVPTVYADQEWLVPAEGLTDTANDDGTFDITVRNTDGCHLYYITVGDGDAPVVEDAKKVAYLYEGDGLEEDEAYTMLSGNGVLDLTGIDITTNPTLESLSDYEAAIIAPSVTEANAASVVKPLIAFFPIVNLNADIIGQDGLNVGTKQQSDETSLTFVDETNAIFEGLDNPLEYGGNISTVTFFPSSKFKNDDVLAKAGTSTAIHAHKIGRNAYYFVPIDNASEDAYILAANAVIAAAKTKRAIAAVGTPSITFTQADGKSTVTIAATNSEAIYYTLDGTDPTAESTKYTEPFDVTENVTVKAFATGEGYTDSEVGSKEVIIATQLAKPQIQVAREAGKSTITLTAVEGAKVYFNFNGATTTTASQEYTEPIVLTEPATIYAIAAAENYLNSEPATQFVGVNGVDNTNIRLDILAHMDANSADWSTVGSEESRSSKVNYIFGKKEKSMYTTEIESQTVVYDEDGVTPLKSKVPGQEDQDSILITYKKVEQMVVTNVKGDWKVTSYGQVMTWENPTPGTSVGVKGSNNPETAADHLTVDGTNGVTKYMLNFKGKKSGEPYNATIETTGKYAGPFDIVVYLNNGSAGSYPKVDIEYSANGTDWVKIDTCTTHNERFMKRTKVSYEGTDEVYVRLAHKGGNSAGQVFDIYILNSGEKSAAYSEEATGIKNVKAAKKAAGIYGINGVRRQALGRGLNIVIDEQGRAKKVVK